MTAPTEHPEAEITDEMVETFEQFEAWIAKYEARIRTALAGRLVEVGFTDEEAASDHSIGPLTEGVMPILREARRGGFEQGKRAERKALTEAGRLLPEGGDTRVELGTDGGQHIPGWRRTCRAVTTWPDGTTLTGPWQPVDTEGER